MVELRPAPMTFVGGFLLALAIEIYFVVGMAVIAFDVVRKAALSIGADRVWLLALCGLGFALGGAAMMRWLRNEERKSCWKCDQLGIRVFRDDALICEIPWTEVKRIYWRKWGIAVGLRGKWVPLRLSGVSRREIRQVREVWKSALNGGVA